MAFVVNSNFQMHKLDAQCAKEAWKPRLISFGNVDSSGNYGEGSTCWQQIQTPLTPFKQLYSEVLLTMMDLN